MIEWGGGNTGCWGGNVIVVVVVVRCLVLGAALCLMPQNEFDIFISNTHPCPPQEGIGALIGAVDLIIKYGCCIVGTVHRLHTLKFD